MFRGGRALLNLQGFQSTAAIVAEVEDTSAWPTGKDEDGTALTLGAWVRVPNYTFQMSNCDRSIAFELDWGTAESHANNLHKIDTLIDTLTEFRAALADEQRLHETRKVKVGTWGKDS